MPTNDKHVVRLPPTSTSAPDRPDDVTAVRSCGDKFDFSKVPIDDYVVLGACGILFITGLLFCVFGKRFQKVTMFAPGFACSTLLIYLVFEHENYLQQSWAHAAIAAGLGCLFGLVSMQVDYVGLFLIGYQGGLVVGSLVIILADQFSGIDTIWLTIGVLFAAGLIGALITLKFDQTAIILITAITGGCLVLASFDWLLQNGVLTKFAWQSLSAQHPPTSEVCIHEWLLTIIWPMVTLPGILLQYRMTNSDKQTTTRSHKTNGKHASSQKREQSTCRRIVERRQMSTDINIIQPVTPPCDSPPIENFRRKSFRSLYQQRQKYGDVICQRLVETRRDTSVDSEPPPAYQPTTTVTLDLS